MIRDFTNTGDLTKWAGSRGHLTLDKAFKEVENALASIKWTVFSKKGATADKYKDTFNQGAETSPAQTQNSINISINIQNRRLRE